MFRRNTFETDPYGKSFSNATNAQQTGLCSLRNNLLQSQIIWPFKNPCTDMY